MAYNKKEYSKIYNEKNKEEIKAQRKEYRIRTRDKISAYNKLYKKTHREKINGSQKEWRNINSDLSSWYGRVYNLKQYGMTELDYSILFEEQGGACAICGKPETALAYRSNRPRNLAVDHDHATGKIRGLLCKKCNLMLGHINEDLNLLQSAIEYLRRHQ